MHKDCIVWAHLTFDRLVWPQFLMARQSSKQRNQDYNVDFVSFIVEKLAWSSMGGKVASGVAWRK